MLDAYIWLCIQKQNILHYHKKKKTIPKLLSYLRNDLEPKYKAVKTPWQRKQNKHNWYKTNL